MIKKLYYVNNSNEVRLNLDIEKEEGQTNNPSS